MALRSTVSSLSKTAPEGEMPAAPAPRLTRRPGIYTPPANAVDIFAPDDEDHTDASEPVPTETVQPTPAPKARKPRAPKAKPVITPAQIGDDVKAARKLLTDVEAQILELRGQMNKALDRFQPKLDRLQARHAELSAALAKALIR